MKRRQIVSPAVSEASRPYSQGVQFGSLVAISGQVSIDGKGDLVAPGDASGQMQQIMSRTLSLLQAVGCDFSQVIKTTIFLKDIADYDVVNEAYGAVFEEPYPSRSTLVVELIKPEYLVEVEFLAVAPSIEPEAPSGC